MKKENASQRCCNEAHSFTFLQGICVPDAIEPLLGQATLEKQYVTWSRCQNTAYSLTVRALVD